MNRKNTVVDAGMIVLLLFAGLLLFPLKGVVPSPDSSWYLDNAFKLYNDFNYENLMIRRPLFPFLMSISFHIFGKSIESGFWVVRLFFVLNLLLSYCAGSKLFNRFTGIAFSLLLLSSFTVNMWSSYLLLDIIIPFFIFVYILTLYQAFENESRLFFILSGLVLGLAFLVKGVFSIFFLFLPVFLMGVKKYKNRNQLKNLLFLYMAGILILSPWLFYCISQNDFFILVGPMFDASTLKASGLISAIDNQGFALWQFLAAQFNDFKIFLNVFIEKRFVLSDLFACSVIYSIIHVLFVKKHTGIIYLLFSLILFSPIIYIGMKSGGFNFRDGQFLLLYFLLYLMSAFMIADVSKRSAGLLFAGSRQKKAGITFFVILTGTSVFFQVFIGTQNGHSFNALIKEKKIRNIYGFSLWQDEFIANDGWANDTTRTASEWIASNIPENETILCQWYYLRMLNYLTENKFDFQFVEYTYSHEHLEKKALFVWPRYNVRVMEGNSFVALYEENLLSQINTGKINYIAVTHRRNFLTLYLQNHPDFKQIYSITKDRRNIKIFKIIRFPVRPDSKFTVKLHKNIYNFFQNAIQENKPVFHYLQNEIKQILNWDEVQLESFVSLLNDSDKKRFWQTYEKVNPRTIY